MAPSDEASSHLPLSERDFRVLFALLDAPLHGYGLVKAIREHSEGTVIVDPANLYRGMQRMIDEGLVRDGERRPAPDSARIRRYYELTDLGRQVLSADAERMRSLVSAASQKDLIPPTGESR
ncbi:MAG: PadR family transcriptional regulator [Acidobacteria bacterium]|nr:PadR family transcriptional regulator [Acidobacteriota bacterium]